MSNSSFTVTNSTLDVSPFQAASGSGIKPMATPVKTDPFAAAKEIRMIAKWLRDHIPEGPAVNVAAPLDRLTTSKLKLQRAQEHLQQASEQARLRRAAPARRHIAQADYQIAQALAYQKHTLQMLNDLALGSSPSAAKSTFRKQLDKLHVLVQALPTERDMPLGAAENVLRAIVTLLRNIGLEAPNSVVVAHEEEASHASS